MGGLGIVWLTLHLVISLTGFHAVAVLGFFAIYATFAMLNHTPYDVQLGVLGLGYTVRAHEMHHRFLKCNYAQNIMGFDQLLGTFWAYRNVA